jgi:hypothetical protein
VERHVCISRTCNRDQERLAQSNWNETVVMKHGERQSSNYTILGRSPTEATRLRFDQEKSSLLVEPSVRNGASHTRAITMR